MANTTDILNLFGDWFTVPGAYVLVDGQYGSTGKGLLAAAMGEAMGSAPNIVTSNAGPNSGHTSYFKGTMGYEKVVLKQLPTFAVAAYRYRRPSLRPIVYLNGGAVIDPDLLRREVGEFLDNDPVFIHPSAAVINAEAREADATNVQNIASTGQGVGEAIVNKLRRRPENVWGGQDPEEYQGVAQTCSRIPWSSTDRIMVEVSQGFSLGINSGFYPHVTSRECSVGQALADAAIPPSWFRRSVLCVRTFPIRVGNTENSSGPCYHDQEEISWADINQKPETTTVTGRERRLFTWSRQQFMDAVLVNQPRIVFVNFMQYLPSNKDREDFIVQLRRDYEEVLGDKLRGLILGYGPTRDDLEIRQYRGT